MSTRKGDDRYTERCDDDGQSDAKSDSSDETEHMNLSARHRRFNWLDSNYDALAESYSQFRKVGEALFGFAFFQLGGFQTYCDFVYNNTCKF